MSINNAAKNIPLIQYLINYLTDYLRSNLNTKNHFLKLNASFSKYYFSGLTAVIIFTHLNFYHFYKRIS
jgi:uncharacterized membrane protein